jgi:hypothetical protein
MKHLLHRGKFTILTMAAHAQPGSPYTPPNPC